MIAGSFHDSIYIYISYRHRALTFTSSTPSISRKRNEMSASFSHFFKHLSCTLSHRRLIHPSPSPLTLFLTSHRVKDPSPCIPRSMTAKLSTSSCPPTTTESFTSSYLSVHIRCPKEVAVSFLSL